MPGVLLHIPNTISTDKQYISYNKERHRPGTLNRKASARHGRCGGAGQLSSARVSPFVSLSHISCACGGPHHHACSIKAGCEEDASLCAVCLDQPVAADVAPEPMGADAFDDEPI